MFNTKPNPKEKEMKEETFRATPFVRLLWAWKALPMTTRRKRLADEVWFWLYGDEAEADAALE